MDAELPEIAAKVKIEALGFSIAGVTGDPNSLNSIIDAIFSGRTEIEAGIEKKQLMPFLETLEVINLACSAKATYSGWEFEPIKHSIVEGDREGRRTTVKLKGGVAKFRQPEEKQPLQEQPAKHDDAAPKKEKHEERPEQGTSVNEKTFAEGVNSLFDSISEAYRRFGKEKYGIEFKIPSIRIYSEKDEELAKNDESEFSKEILGFYYVKKNEVNLSKALYDLYVRGEGNLETVRSTIIHEVGHAMAHQTGLDYSSKGSDENTSILIGKVASELLANLFSVRISAYMENVEPTGLELAKRLVTGAKVEYLSRDTDAAKEYFNDLLELSGKLIGAYSKITSDFDQAEKKVLAEGKKVNYDALTQLYFKDAETLVRKYLGFFAVGTLASELYGGPALGAARELIGGMDFDELVNEASKNLESLKYVNEYLGGAYATEMARFISELGAIDIKLEINNMDLDGIEKVLNGGQALPPTSSRKKYELVVERFGELFREANEMSAEILNNEERIRKDFEELKARLEVK